MGTEKADLGLNEDNYLKEKEEEMDKHDPAPVMNRARMIVHFRVPPGNISTRKYSQLPTNIMQLQRRREGRRMPHRLAQMPKRGEAMIWAKE
jgi:hypothetical protein